MQYTVYVLRRTSYWICFWWSNQPKWIENIWIPSLCHLPGLFFSAAQHFRCLSLTDLMLQWWLNKVPNCYLSGYLIYLPHKKATYALSKTILKSCKYRLSLRFIPILLLSFGQHDPHCCVMETRKTVFTYWWQCVASFRNGNITPWPYI